MSTAQVRAYVAKAEEYLSAATAELDADRPIAATSLAIHADINAEDAVTGVRLGVRAAGQDHDEAIGLLRTAGPDGVAVAKELGRIKRCILCACSPKIRHSSTQYGQSKWPRSSHTQTGTISAF